jgi:hypothetical protein
MGKPRNERINQRTALIPGAKANRERGLSGPATARQRVNCAAGVLKGTHTFRHAVKVIAGR